MVDAGRKETSGDEIFRSNSLVVERSISGANPAGDSVSREPFSVPARVGAWDSSIFGGSVGYYRTHVSGQKLAVLGDYVDCIYGESDMEIEESRSPSSAGGLYALSMLVILILVHGLK